MPDISIKWRSSGQLHTPNASSLWKFSHMKMVDGHRDSLNGVKEKKSLSGNELQPSIQYPIISLTEFS
jgi:hypothetical protein